MTRRPIIDDVTRYYESMLATHGPTPGGVDWNTEASQHLRFAQFLPLLEGSVSSSVLDYGCGYGALLEYLRARGQTGPFTGFDRSPAMVEAARRLHVHDSHARFVDSRQDVGQADFTMASGIFNVRIHATDGEWLEHVLATLRDLNALSRRGFAFNALTSYSDRDTQRPDLYYADPRVLFDFCKCHCDARVALLHDYPLYEFTILVKR